MDPIYDGQSITYTGTFKNSSGVVTDPTTASLVVENDSGLTTYSGGSLTHVSTGIYTYVQVVALTNSARAETFKWRWVGTGTVAGADQGEFTVLPRNTI